MSVKRRSVHKVASVAVKQVKVPPGGDGCCGISVLTLPDTGAAAAGRAPRTKWKVLSLYVAHGRGKRVSNVWLHSKTLCAVPT